MMDNTTAARTSGPRAQGVAGVKMLISSLALVATLGGWVRLAGEEPKATQGAPAPPAPLATNAEPAQPQRVSYRVGPLPTLVPLIAPPQPGARRSPGLAAAQPAAANAMPALASLRMVSAPPPPPPAPVAVSRSSR